MENQNKPQKIVLSGCIILNEKRELLLLYRKKHQHYETPGGKVRVEECYDKENPSIEELKKTAERETYEELGDDIKLDDLKYFGKVEFVIPDGRKAISHKFVTRITEGLPKVNEPEIFERFDWIPSITLGERPLSPDLILFMKKINDFVQSLIRDSL